MRVRVLALCAVASLPVQGQLVAGPPILTFDAPGAIHVAGSLDGTFPESINDAGLIAGRYLDEQGVFHGFVRSADGTITTLAVPDSGANAGKRRKPAAAGAVPATITGSYVDANNVNRGFLLTPDGEVVTINAPGARSAVDSFDGTFPSGINDAGAIAGYFVDSNGLTHGFFQDAKGGFTKFDAPGASSAAGSGDGTIPTSINQAGIITGYYTDARNVNRGFVRTAGGQFTTFEAAGPVSVAAWGSGTFPESINAAGAIAGRYEDAQGSFHGFIRSLGGDFIRFDAPGASTSVGAGGGTLVRSINAGGAVTGHYVDARNVSHGFLRTADGRFSVFDAPGAGSTPGSGFGTFPVSINDAGAVTGYFIDAQNLSHGFLRMP